MTYRLPPLNALRAFEAAARHLSFKQAAAELHVTPGAVSQQVKTLEETLGVRLFEREPNGLMLTLQGQQYLAPIRSALTSISTATRMVSPREGDAALTVGAETHLAVNWLVPKMPEFQRRHPDVRLRIGEAKHPEAVLAGEVDLAILSGVSAYAGLKCDLVLEERYAPVCSADYLGGRGGAGGEVSLEDSILLVAEDEPMWEAWLAAAKGPKLAGCRRIDFAERGLAVRAALAGQGVALGSTLHEARELEAGGLVRPFGESVGCGADFFAVYPPGRADCPAEKAFLDWLL